MHIKTNTGYHTEFYKDFQGDFKVFLIEGQIKKYLLSFDVVMCK